MRAKIKKEIEIMKMLKNEKFVNFLGEKNYFEDSSDEEKDSQKNEIIEIYMEDICGKSLKHIAKSLNGLDIKLIKKYGKSILEGINYLHNNRILHLDIKADNILISNTGDIKIIDFGESIKFEIKKNFELPFAGTESHMAPEIFIKMNPDAIDIYGEIENRNFGKSDIWSVGITFVEMFVGEIRDLEKKRDKLNISIIREIINIDNIDIVCDKILFICVKEILDKVNIEIEDSNINNILSDIITNDDINDEILYFIDFVCCCLESNLDRRFSSKDLLEHCFINDEKIKKIQSNRMNNL